MNNSNIGMRMAAALAVAIVGGFIAVIVLAPGIAPSPIYRASVIVLAAAMIISIVIVYSGMRGLRRLERAKRIARKGRDVANRASVAPTSGTSARSRDQMLREAVEALVVLDSQVQDLTSVAMSLKGLTTRPPQAPMVTHGCIAELPANVVRLPVNVTVRRKKSLDSASRACPWELC